MQRTIIIPLTCICLCLVSVTMLSAFERIRLEGELKGNIETPCDVAISAKGNIYVLDSRESRVAVFGPDRIQTLLFGKRGSKIGEFNRPRALAIGPDKRIAVADSGNRRIQVFEPDGTFAFFFGESGSGKGAFRDPSGVAVDHFGFFFVADSGNERISVFGPGGGFLTQWKTQGQPTDIEIDPQRNVYVLMPGSKKIIQYSSWGKKQAEFSCVSGKRDRYSQNGDISVDRRGNILITGNEEGNIQKIGPKQKLLLSFGSEGSGRGQFDEPAGIASDTAGRIFVADSGNSRIQIFSTSGSTRKELEFAQTSPPFLELKKTIPSRKNISSIAWHSDKGLYTLSNEAKIPIVLYSQNAQSVYGKSGRNSGEFSEPMALCISASEKLFITDTRNSRIQVLDLNGKFQFEFGDHGSKNGQFSRPEGIVTTKAAVYVSDTGNNRIQIFSPDGIFFQSFEGDRDKDRDLRSPGALAVDSKKQLYVLDTGNHRVQVYNAEGKFIKIIGKKGEGPGEFRNPTDLVIDQKDCLYVADQQNSRIQVFDPQGLFLTATGCSGKSQSAFESLSAIAVKGDILYAADTEKDFVQVFHYHRNGLSHTGKGAADEPARTPEKTQTAKTTALPAKNESPALSQPTVKEDPPEPKTEPVPVKKEPEPFVQSAPASVEKEKPEKKSKPSAVIKTPQADSRETEPLPDASVQKEHSVQAEEPSKTIKAAPTPQTEKDPVEIPPLLTVPAESEKPEVPEKKLENVPKKIKEKRFGFDREFKE